MSETDVARAPYRTGQILATLDLLSEISGFLNGMSLTRLLHHSTFRDWFAQILMASWRAFPIASVVSERDHAAVDSTDFGPDQPSIHYANGSYFHVRTLNVTAFVDVETLYITDGHIAASTSSGFRISPQTVRPTAERLRLLEADHGYDDKAIRDETWATGFGR